MVTIETLERMINSFTGEEEYAEFLNALMVMSVELNFVNEYCKRHQGNSQLMGMALAKGLVMFSSFARNHIEEIKGLINTVQIQSVEVAQEPAVEQEDEEDCDGN